MLTKEKTCQELIDVTRIHDAALTMCQSGEALFRYFSRLDALQDANLSREAIAERALEAELQTRLLLGAAMDALNELNDLGLLNSTPNDEEINFFNQTKLSEAGREMTKLLRENMPGQNWDWLDEATALVEDIDMRIERHEDGLRGTVTGKGKPKVIHIDPGASPQRVSARQFFSDGPDRIFVPTSSIFSRTDSEPEPVAGYDAVVGGLVFAREWMHRHARYATEIGPPARTGGGPVLAGNSGRVRHRRSDSSNYDRCSLYNLYGRGR